MKTHKLPSARLALLAAPLCLALHPRGEDLSFQPAEGLRLAKELKVELTFHLEDFSVSLNGEPMPDAMMGDMDEAMLLKALVSVTDEYVASARGKHRELLRTFDKLKLEGGQESELEAMDQFAEFEGATVRFKWDEEDEDYDKSFHEGSGSADALESLSPDMDFLALLPTGEVSPGDKWSVADSRIGYVFFPGGMAPVPGGEGAEAFDVFTDELDALLEEAFAGFEFRCVYAGSHEEDERLLGEITFDFDSKASIDLTDLLQSIIDMQAGEMEGLDLSLQASVDVHLKGTGTLHWDIAGHHVQAFEMDSEMTFLLDVDADMSMMGQSQSAELAAEVSGTGEWKLTTSPAR